MIATERLDLQPATLPMLVALNDSPARLGTLLDLAVLDGWPEFPAAYRSMEQTVRDHPTSAAWWLYFFVDRAANRIVGSGGYKGPPHDGMVEIGYEIAPDARRQGYATEAARGMIDRAWGEGVQMVDAHTLPEINPSTRVLENRGMRLLGTVDDPDDGPICHWQVNRPADYSR